MSDFVKDTNVPTNGYISRQAVIEAVNAHYDDEYFNFYTVMDILKQLPSVQPEVAKDTNVPSNDCISRQVAIDAAIEAVDEWDGGCNLTRADMIADAINNTVPSAQPDIIRCKECKHYTFEPGPNSINCYVQHCTRSVRVSTSPDEFCSRAERKEERRTDEQT